MLRRDKYKDFILPAFNWAQNSPDFETQEIRKNLNLLRGAIKRMIDIDESFTGNIAQIEDSFTDGIEYDTVFESTTDVHREDRSAGPYAGWGQMLLIGQDFNGIHLETINCANDVKLVEIEIRINAVNGPLVTTATDNVIEGSTETGDLFFIFKDGDALRTIPAGRYFIGYRAYKDEAKTVKGYLSYNGVNDLSILDGNCYYYAFSNWTVGGSGSQINLLNVQENGKALRFGNFYDQFKRALTHLRYNPDPIVCNLPNKIYGVEGHELNIHFEGILEDSSRYKIKTDSNTTGKLSDRYWRITPQAGDVGDKTLDLTVYSQDIDKVYTHPTTSLKIAAANARSGETKSVLLVGDSIFVGPSDSTNVAAHLKALSNGDAMTLNMVGTQGAVGAKHEAYNGYNPNSFLTSAPSPFVFGGAYNFDQYVTNELNGTPPDYCVIHLGVNNIVVIIEKYQPWDYSHIYEQLETMGNGMVDAGVGKVIICTLIPPAATQNAFSLYTDEKARWNYVNHWIKVNEGMIEAFQGHTTFDLLDMSSVDPLYDMKTSTVNASARNTTQVELQVDPIHPNEFGTGKMADNIFYYVKNQ
jgi:hypothetical protein